MGDSPIPVGNDNDSLGAGRQAISRERGLAAQLREARLDLPVDVREALVVADERALHRVQGELLHVVEGEAEDAREAPELLRQRHVGHEPVVGVHGHAESLLHELTDRMLVERRDRAGVDVARRAELERDALVADIRGERSQLHDGLIDDRHVLDEANPVPDAVRAAVLERLPDRGRTERLAGVDRDREVLAPAELERLEVGFRWRGYPAGPGWWAGSRGGGAKGIRWRTWRGTTARAHPDPWAEDRRISARVRARRSCPGAAHRRGDRVATPSAPRGASRARA